MQTESMTEIHRVDAAKRVKFRMNAIIYRCLHDQLPLHSVVLCKPTRLRLWCAITTHCGRTSPIIRMFRLPGSQVFEQRLLVSLDQLTTRCLVTSDIYHLNFSCLCKSLKNISFCQRSTLDFVVVLAQYTRLCFGAIQILVYNCQGPAV
jgi:hypothetical protein